MLVLQLIDNGELNWCEFVIDAVGAYIDGLCERANGARYREGYVMVRKGLF